MKLVLIPNIYPPQEYLEIKPMNSGLRQITFDESDTKAVRITKFLNDLDKSISLKSSLGHTTGLDATNDRIILGFKFTHGDDIHAFTIEETRYVADVFQKAIERKSEVYKPISADVMSLVEYLREKADHAEEHEEALKQDLRSKIDGIEW